MTIICHFVGITFYTVFINNIKDRKGHTEKMNANQLKYLLRNFYTMQTKIEFIEKYANKNNETIINNTYYENKRIVEMIKDVWKVLEDEEKFIIQTHLICHHTWIETTEMFSKKFGYEKERSERTLKRFQNKAIQKMLVLINTTKEFF